MDSDVVTEPRAKIRRTVRRVAELDVAAVLASAEGGPRFAWDDRRDRRVAVGQAAVLTAQGRDRADAIRLQAKDVLERLVADPDPDAPAFDPRFYGGFAFHADHEPDGRWAAFPSAHFVLPRREYAWRDGDLWQIDHETEAKAEPFEAVATRQPRDADQDQEYDRWRAAVDRVVDRIQDGELTKLVLARAERHTARHDAAEVFVRLYGQEDPTIRFLAEPVSGHAFYGASPELLLRLSARTLETSALAGSIGRGAGSSEDAALGRLLQANPKDSLEHELVVSYLLERLANLHVDEIVHEPRRLMKLANVQHLMTAIEAQTPDGTHVLDLVDRLHPTPAVGGIPREESLRMIQELEAFRRGWYAGAVGWFDASGDGVFTTAIRSALTTPHATWLFAGAGIVAGSEAEAEWREARLKMRLMAQALGASDA